MRSRAIGRGAAVLSLLLLGSACGSSSDATGNPTGAAGASSGTTAGAAGDGTMTAGAGNQSGQPAANGGGSTQAEQAGMPSTSGDTPTLAGCAILPNNHLFNTPIAGFPAHESSGEFMKAVGAHNIHLDLGTTVDPQSAEYYGIPYNVVHG